MNLSLASMDQKTEQGKNTCDQCGSENLIRDYETGEIACIDCGCIIDERVMDNKSEWRAFDWEETAKKRRVGTPINYAIHDKGLSTTIDWNKKNSIMGKLSSHQLMELQSIRKWEKKLRVSDYSQRSLFRVLSEISRISMILNLPRNTLEMASVIYRKTAKKKIFFGIPTDHIAAATIYTACRKCNIPRTLDEISSICNLNRNMLAKSYRILLKGLGISILPFDSRQFIGRISNILKLSVKTEILALKIYEAVKKTRIISGMKPNSIAASTIYVAMLMNNEKRKQSKIAKASNVTEVTIRTHSKRISKELSIEIGL